MPHSALTRWLKQGLARGMCPLCRAAHKLDREYMWHFFDERSCDEDALDEVAAARGFCADHAEQLRRIEVDGLKSTIAISDVYEHTLQTLASDLDALGHGDALSTAACPECVNRDDGVARNARYLLDELAENAEFRERFRAAPGLCLPHFALVWDAARTSDERTLLPETQLDAVRSTLVQLHEHLRKQRAEFSREPAGAEADAWQRAIWLSAGWPHRHGQPTRPRRRANRTSRRATTNARCPLHVLTTVVARAFQRRSERCGRGGHARRERFETDPLGLVYADRGTDGGDGLPIPRRTTAATA